MVYAARWLAVLVLAAAAPVLAQSPAATPVPATVGTSQQIDFTSAVNGKTYRITVAKPYAFPPKGGYPVVYVLDGGAYFGTFAGAARLRSALGGELAAAVIVGVSYPSESMLVAQDRRMLDLTHNSPEAARQPRGARGKVVETGGADAFYKVIDTEIRPRVAAVAQVAQGRDVLFGHSLGGLFVLYTLFQHPDAFRTYLALSPSVWWTGKSVLKGEAAFAARVKAGQTTPRVFIGVGSEEQRPSETSAAELRMVDNATELATRLAALNGATGYLVEGKVFAGQSHISVPWEALNTMLNFALGKGSQQP